MEYRKQAKAAMNEKISRMTAPLKGSVDASGWEVYDPLNADAKTGMRPVSRRAYKKGGKVDAKPEGKMCGGRADRKARQSGGKAATPNNLINRNVKEANQERDGVKHVGGMESGGRAKKFVGGGMPYGGVNFGIPQGVGVSKAREMSGYKKGGKVSKEEWEHSKEDLKQDKKLAKKRGMSMEKWEKSKADEKHDKQQSSKGLKAGGRAKKQEGGMLDDYYKKTYTGRGIRAAIRAMGMKDPYEDRPSVEMDAPKVNRAGKGDRQPTMDQSGIRKASQSDPYEDRPLVEPAYKNGGSVNSELGEAVGHAIAAYHRMQDRHARKSGGRVGKAAGGGFGEDMNNPKPKAEKPSKGSKTPTINITINTTPKAPMPMVPGGPTMPLGAPPAGVPPMADLGPGPGGMPPMAGPAMGAGAPPPPPGPMPLPRKRGGRAMTAGAGSGVGRLEKIDAYGSKA